MAIEDALRKFIECHQEILESLNELRITAKEEGSKIIQNHVKEENFTSATKVIKELDTFTKIEFESNIERIISSAQSIFEGTEKLIEKETKHISVSKEIGGILLSEMEKETLEIVGLTGVSRIQDSKKEIKIQTLNSLEEKGLLRIEDIQWGVHTTKTFELTIRGKQKFKELFGMEATDSFKTEIVEKYGSVEKGFFLYDVESSLQLREFTVNELNGADIEVSKDNKHYYLTSLYNNVDEKEYFKILDEKNSLKSIGFICADKASLTKAKEATEKWTTENESRCRFLSVHLATIEDIKNSPKVFETLSY